jgi:hypothetical protein
MNTNLILVEDLTGGRAEQESEEDEPQEGWVPNEAYLLAHGFRKQFGNELTPELINDMLRDLNRIWREREKKQLTRIKAQYQQEVAQLKRRLLHRAPLDEVVSKKNIATLRKQVSSLHDELFKTTAKLQTQEKVPAGMDLIEQTLMLVATLQKQRKEL